MWLSNNGGGSSPGPESASKSAESSSTLVTELQESVSRAAPSARLPYGLRCRLKRLRLAERQAVVNAKFEGNSSLFVAARKGNVEIVEYLLSECGADVEQRGLYEVQNDPSVHSVTPLWCASVAGHKEVVQTLLRFGADVNAVSDSGSTPVRSACFMTHLDIVKILVWNKADVQKANHSGGTCLINAVQSVELCRFLLENGANVNAQDTQLKTALHYAIQEHRLETTILLLEWGADPFLQTRCKDDALQLACLKGAAEIVKFLVDNVSYTPERVASAFELLGATFFDDYHDNAKALQYWRAATDIRAQFKISKLVLPPKPQLHNAREFANREDLEMIAVDLDAMRCQSLLICERVLGTAHKDTIFRLMYRGASYADSLQYQQCIDLWRYAVQLRIQKDSLLSTETCFTAQSLARLLLDLYERSRDGLIHVDVQIQDVFALIDMLATDLDTYMSLLTVRPQFEKQQSCFDRLMSIIAHMLLLAVRLLESNRELECELRRKAHWIMRQIRPRTSEKGNTLLHVCLSHSTMLRGHESSHDEMTRRLFPCYELTQLLLECGADPNECNSVNETPLHVAASPLNYKHEIVELLLRYNGHIDVRSEQGQTPSGLLQSIPGCKVNPLQYMSLKCLAAAVINRQGLAYRCEVPAALEAFVERH